MKISYSLKHAETGLINPILGTKTVNELYGDTTTNSLLCLVVNGVVYWHQRDGMAFLIDALAKDYKMLGDKRFATFPKGSVVTFEQT
jgi:hypothetical protein